MDISPEMAAGVAMAVGIAIGWVLRGEPRARMDDAPRAPPPPLSGNVDAEIRRLVRAGNKISAIKLYREKTGAGLKEAKDAVDRMR